MTISKTFEARDKAGAVIEGGITFTEGIADFDLKDQESISIIGLPTDLPYEVVENPTESQRLRTRTKVEKDDGGEAVSLNQTGKIGLCRLTRHRQF